MITTRTDHPQRIPRLLGILIVLLASLPLSGPVGAKSPRSKPPGDRPKNPQDLEVVDCLLPGQLRKLGRQQTYVTQRRPVRTTAVDCEIRGGEYVAYDRASYETALRVWLDTAQAGDAQAQYYVGEIYEKGLGREPDYVKAAEWYRKAADAGKAQAQINLGFLYEKGLGVPQDSHQALEWYRKAAGVSGVIMLDSEVAAIRKELADSDARLKKATADSEALELQLAASRKKVDASRGSNKGGDLERQMKALEQQLGTSRQEVAQLRESKQRYQITGPTIEIIDTTAVRGTTPTRTADNQELVGRVEAQAGLDELRVNGKPQRVDANGFFRLRPGAERRFTIVAIDLQGKRAEVRHDLDAAHAPAGAGAGSTARPAKGAKFGAYHALVIGNGAYRSLARLETPTADAAALAKVLKDRYGFKVTLLQDASYLDILSAFGALREALSDADNLLVYYAGHGELDSATGLGYWLPVDAAKDDRTNWMSSREIGLQVSLLPAKHVLLVADSCYAGALTRSSLAHLDGASESDRETWIKGALAKRSRTALTSGGLSPVLDAGGGGHSIFTGALLDALARNAGVLETYRLWSSVKARVMLETRSLPQEQVPEYAPIQYAGHESGEFFFVPAG